MVGDCFLFLGAYIVGEILYQIRMRQIVPWKKID
jgi:hypothetical protein